MRYVSYRTFFLSSIVLVAVVLTEVSRSRWNDSIQSLEQSLALSIEDDDGDSLSSSKLSKQEWDDLPEPVQRYLIRVFSDADTVPLGQVISTPRDYAAIYQSLLLQQERLARSVSIQQTGQLQLPSMGWMPFTAVQTLNPHGFTWIAKVRMLSKRKHRRHADYMFSWLGKQVQDLLTVTVCDAWVNHIGYLDVRTFYNALPIVKSQELPQDVLAQGEAMRWLAEAVGLLPTISLGKLVTWSSFDESKNQVKASMTIDGKRVSVVFTIDDEGWIKKVEGSRPDIHSKDEIVMRDWIGLFSDYRWIDGMWIPTHMEAGYRGETDLDLEKDAESGIAFYFSGDNLDLVYDFEEKTTA